MARLYRRANDLEHDSWGHAYTSVSGGRPTEDEAGVGGDVGVTGEERGGAAMEAAGIVISAVSAGGGVDGTDEEPTLGTARRPSRPEWSDPLVEEVSGEAGPAEEQVGEDLEHGERGIVVTKSPSHPYAMVAVPVNVERGIGEVGARTLLPTDGAGGSHGRASSPVVGTRARVSACVVVVAMTLIPSSAARHKQAVGVARTRWAASVGVRVVSASVAVTPRVRRCAHIRPQQVGTRWGVRKGGGRCWKRHDAGSC